MNLTLAPSDLWWVAIVVGLVLKSVVVLAGAAAVVLALRRSSAAARHLVWSLALAGTLLLPPLTLVLPSWSWSILPDAAFTTPPDVKSARDAGRAHSPAPLGFDWEDEPGDFALRADDMTRPSHSATGQPGPATASAVNAAKAASSRGPWPPWIWALGVWAAGAALALAGPLLGKLMLRCAARGAVPVESGEWAELARDLSRRLGVRRRVTILRGARAVIPMTWGWIRPVVLLPARAGDWPPGRRRDVLLHELAHVRRLDCLTQSVAQMACAVYWFNPLAWLAAQRMRIERERACDDVVLLAGSSASDYAAHLLEIARGLRSDRLTALAAVAMAQSGPFEGRLRAILDSKRSRSSISYRSAALVTAAIAGGLIVLASVRLGAHGATAIESPASQAAGERQPGTASSPRITVTGLVVDPQGKPVPNAAVMIYTQPKVFERPTLWKLENRLIIGQARADGSGRFRIDAPRTSSATHELLGIAALAPGYGIGWVEVDPDAEEPTAKIALRPELVIQGRLFDVQGVPARGVKVVVSSVQRSAQGELEGPIFEWNPPEPLPAWPQPATTDAGGHFTLRGLGRELLVALAIDDARFASQGPLVLTGGSIDAGPLGNVRPIVKLDTKSGSNQLTLALEPAQIITGRVTYADTGTPAPHAPLLVNSRSGSRGGFRVSRFEADSEGRFRIHPLASDHFFVSARPSLGQPYLEVNKNIDWPKGSVEQSVDLALPRGVAIRGTLTEKASGKPVAGAVVRFTPYTMPTPQATTSTSGTASVTSSDGSFRIAAVPDQGYLVVQAPSDDYVLREMGNAWGAVFYARPGDVRCYAHGFSFLDLKAARAEQVANLTVERGLTVRGQVVGPDGRPVEDAFFISRLILRSVPTGGWKTWGLGRTRGHVRGGRFELHGLAPDTDVPVYFLDSQHQLGATIQLSGKSAKAGPVTVRLEPCGTARARLVDSGGKPLSGLWLRAVMIVTPGATRPRAQQQPGQLLREASGLDRLDPAHYPKFPVSGADGRIVFPALIPGATYLVSDLPANQDRDGPKSWNFTVKPGETLDLGDIVIKKPRAVN